MNAESVAERRGRPVVGATGVGGLGRARVSRVRPARVRLRTAGVAVAVAATLLTSACAAGRAAQTADQVPTQDGVNATVGAIALRGLSIEAPTSTYYVPGSDVVVNLVLINTGHDDDALTGVTTDAATSWGSYASIGAATQVQKQANSAALASAAPSAAPAASKGAQTVLLPAGERVAYGVPDATRELLLTGTKGRLYPGNSITIDFSFARAGDIKVIVPIQLSANPGDQTVSAPPSADGE